MSSHVILSLQQNSYQPISRGRYKVVWDQIKGSARGQETYRGCISILWQCQKYVLASRPCQQGCVLASWPRQQGCVLHLCGYVSIEVCWQHVDVEAMLAEPWTWVTPKLYMAAATLLHVLRMQQGSVIRLVKNICKQQDRHQSNGILDVPYQATTVTQRDRVEHHWMWGITPTTLISFLHNWY